MFIPKRPLTYDEMQGVLSRNTELSARSPGGIRAPIWPRLGRQDTHSGYAQPELFTAAARESSGVSNHEENKLIFSI